MKKLYKDANYYISRKHAKFLQLADQEMDHRQTPFLWLGVQVIQRP